MTSETVTEEKETPDEVLEDVVNQTEQSDGEQQEQPTEEVAEQKKEEFVPVSAHVAERKKRQEAEQKAQWYEQQMMQMQKPEQKQSTQDNSDDLLTVGQQQQTLNEWKRSILEEAYLEQNPDIVDKIKDELPDLLKDPKYKWLAESIPQAPNRLQRAAQVYEIIKSKKEPVQQNTPSRTNVPKSPQAVAKTNKLSMADRIMSMSDQELDEWRQSQKRKVR